MTDDPLAEYRRELMARFVGQIADFTLHPALADGPGLHQPIKPGEWSPHRVAFHLRAVEAQAYAPRLRRILEHERPELADFDEGAWMAEHYAQEESVRAILDGWQEARRESSQLLNGIAASAWSRTGQHVTWGERTLQWWVERALAHAEEHRRQLDGE